MSDNVVRNKLLKKIGSLSFDKDDLRKLLNILQLRANAASEIEYKKLELKQPDNLENIRKNLNDCASLRISVTGFQSEELFGTIDEVFNSVSFPEAIKTIYLNSDLIYRSTYQYYPENFFQLLIDFPKPKVLILLFSLMNELQMTPSLKCKVQIIRGLMEFFMRLMLT